MVADTPPSRAGSLLQLDWVHLRNIDRLAGRLRWQASSHNWIGCICEILIGWQAAFAGRPAPTIGLGVSAKCWLAGRPPSRAGQLPQWNVGTCKRMVGCQAAFAGKPRSYSGMGVPAKDWSAVRPPSRASLAPTVEWVYLQEIGRLSGRLREQARSYKVWCMPERKWSAGRPPSRASLAPTRGSVYTLRFSPLIRPSVSSPAFDLDLPAPSGG